MPKQKKKRDKTYKGSSASASSSGSVTRISAVERSKVNQWWFDHKRIAKPVIILIVVIFVVFILVEQIIRLLTS